MNIKNYHIKYSKHNPRLITVVPACSKVIRRALVETMKFYQLHFKFDKESYGYNVNLGLLNAKTLIQQFDLKLKVRCYKVS